MAKAQITTPEGITVSVDGTATEIAAVIAKLKATAPLEAPPAKLAGKKAQKAQRTQLVDLVDSLIDGGFFKKPRDLAGVKAALAEMGHHYPVTTLSGAMLRKVRSRSLRRLKQEKRWFYTG